MCSHISIDFKGLLKEVEGYNDIVTAIDYTSKLVEAEPLKEKSGETVAKFLYKHLCTYGACDIHITYQGGELINSITDEFYHVPDIHHHIASSYHPQANGPAECENA